MLAYGFLAFQRGGETSEGSVPNDVGIFTVTKDLKFVNLNINNLWLPTENSVDVVYFKQVECPACKVFDPIFSSFTSWAKSNYGNSVNIYVIVLGKTEHTPNYVIESFINYNVRATPTVIFFKNGVEVERVVGVTDISKLKNVLINVLS